MLPHCGQVVSMSISCPKLAIRIAVSTAVKSVIGICHASLIDGMQLCITSTTDDPLNKASGVLYVISSIAVIGITGTSPESGISNTPSGYPSPLLGKSR